ncbi:unnamed protein product [Miscanthus lutarioriparius]|uniref:PAP/OAS1 substrate-binding domain superfamily n=1 Tax=Miscanthus lutarioriparius TaxID=422564 RepID=A0A811QI55_9POAL|nr:unnamed protein product [Miscanthus lutarioriparius]
MVDISECSPVPESVPAHPDPASVSPDAWRRFETAALAVVNKIQPTAASEQLRAAVIEYVQRLFWFQARYQVFPFGSVPLKTYLPDGDIDLTLFGPAISDENLANEVCAILKLEERRKDSEFEVKDVHYVPAEVKLVKCLVQNIVVDISVNQIGGLCTLCFLEKVDQNFGKNHLFKRSIMLVKDWCYYESRILGAHHGLISTYALETLVLYIFHIFHKSLDGPLAVLYRFLDYYSKFDWDNKGISLFGPVSLSSLPELVTDPPDTQDDDFLQREEFLKECTESFSVLPRNSETNPRVFSRRFLNIVDPLKQSNNLGRSVSKGNFYRIMAHLIFGARKLGKILQVPSCPVSEVNQFFRNTLKRNRTGLRPDVWVSSSDLVTNDPVSSVLDAERVNKVTPNNSCDVLSNQLSNINISDSNNHGPVKQKECNSMADHKEIKSVSWGLLDSDATSHTATDSGGDFSEASPTPSETCTLQSETGQEVLTSDTQPGGTTNDTVPNLTGDFDTNLHNLLYARGFHQDSPTTQLYYPMPMPPPLQYQNMHPSNGHGRKNLYGYASRNGVVPGPVYPPGYFVYRPLYQADDHMAMRARGTGTYFPDPNLRKERPPTGRGERGRNHSHQNNYQKFHHHARPDIPVDMIPFDELRHEPPLQIYAPSANDHGIPSPMNIPIPSPSSQSPRDPLNVPMHSPSSQVRKDNFHGNGFMLSQDSKLEFGTLGALPREVASKEHASRSGSASNNQGSGPVTVSPMSMAKNTGMGSNGMRNVQVQPYRLKDSGDFPPLSS